MCLASCTTHALKAVPKLQRVTLVKPQGCAVPGSWRVVLFLVEGSDVVILAVGRSSYSKKARADVSVAVTEAFLIPSVKASIGCRAGERLAVQQVSAQSCTRS